MMSVAALVAAFLATGLAACAGSDGSEPTPDPTVSRLTELDAGLIEAAWANDVDGAATLIEAGADVNAKDSTGQSAYLIATSEGYTELLDLTLLNGADVASLDSFNGTGLIRAAERGHAEIVGRLLQAGVDVDHVNRLGWTALHEAIILGTGDERYVDTVRLLVARGADLGPASEEDGKEPIEHARDRGQETIAEILALDGTGMLVADANASLLEAAAAGDADAVAYALRAGAEIEARDAGARTPLLLAAANDQLDVARLLVALGADANALDDRRETPWLATGVTGSVAMLEALLPAEPDMTVVNRFGGVSVIPASERGHVDYVRRVVTTEIDVNHMNNLGWTALLEAVILGDGSMPYQEIVEILLEAGADPTIADGDNVTALEHAQAKGQDAVARILQGK